MESELLGLYDDVCGRHDRETFCSVVLPQLKELYGGNVRRIGLSALGIIKEGFKKTAREIDNFFTHALEEDLKARDKVPRMQEVERMICNSILEGEVEFQERFQCHYNIVGAVVIGAFAKGQAHPGGRRRSCGRLAVPVGPRCSEAVYGELPVE